MVVRSARPAASASPAGADFEWRVPAGRWRWLILSALGFAPNACGGRTDTNASLEGQGGTQGHPGTPVQGGVSGTGTASGGSTAAQPTPVAPPGGGAGGGEEPITSPSTCENPVSLGGGWLRCDNGLRHRTAIGECASSVPRPGPVPIPPESRADIDAGVFLACRQDADCSDAAYGYCQWYGQWPPGTFCNYGCRVDSDCGPGQVCVCGEPVGLCASARCSADSDCSSGQLCADVRLPGCGGTAFACQRADDACAAAGDCPESQFCSLDRGGEGDRRVCALPGCDVGRPFLIDGLERLAPPCARADWYSDGDVVHARPSLDPALRAELARSWTQQGLMEHASVAAFARFTLQLLSLGAPASLVKRSGDAMQDEIRHARSCFELARDYSEGEVGPGPLRLDGALEASDLCSIVLDTVVEGCIGETVAAYEAAEAHAHCEQPKTRALLERIAAEESQHAELAWQFVAWALAAGSRELAAQVRGAFTVALAGARAPRLVPGSFERELLRHGVVGGELRSALRARVLAEVIAPCARALLDSAHERGLSDHPGVTPSSGALAAGRLELAQI